TPQGHESLLIVGPPPPIGRLRCHPCTSLPTVAQSLVPYFPSQRVVRQLLDLLSQAVGGEAFEGLHDTSVQHAPSLLEQTAVGYLVRQGVLAGVGLGWKE